MQPNFKNLFKVFLSFACLIFFAVPVQAERVEIDKAERLSQRYIQSKRQLSTAVNIHLKYTATARHKMQKTVFFTGGAQTDVQDTVYYYVFNINEDVGGGFIIISGDDVVTPVLGYSEHGSYDENNLPPNFVYWMNYLQQEISYAQTKNLPQSEVIKKKWETYLNGNIVFTASAVSPLLQTTWDQDAPYWDLCPEKHGFHTYTGCGATAMAQIMKYYNYPAQGIGQSEAYTTSSGLYIDMVDFAATTYDWANMLNTYSFGGYKEEHVTAVATLMYHCGVSLQMQYDINGSMAYTFDVPDALHTYFGYDKSAQYKMRDFCDNTTWENMLRTQIDADMPVFYAGYDPAGGHAFVCDGYDDSGLFHFNWGWSGWCDGYFVTDALDIGAYDFSIAQEIVINIKPDDGGVLPNDEYGLVLYYDFSSSTISAKHGIPFNVSATIANFGKTTFMGGLLGVALVDSSNRIVEIVGTQTMDELYSYYYYELPPTNCSVSNSVAGGAYKLKIMVRPTGKDWEIITLAVACPSELDFYVDTTTPVVIGVNLNKSATTITIGKTEQLTATVLPVDAVNKTVTWKSSNTTAATVNSTGLVTAIAAGTTIITVTTQEGSYTASCTVTVNNQPINLTAFTLDNGAQIALRRTVNLNYTFNGGIPTHFRVAESAAALSSAIWETYSPSALTYSFVTETYELKTVYTQLKNSVGETAVRSASIFYKPIHAKLTLTAFSMNNNAMSTNNRIVTLNHTVENGIPELYSVSENPLQVGKIWLPYVRTPLFELSENNGMKEVYFAVANSTDTSNILSAKIHLDQSITVGGNGLKAKLFPNPAENYLNVIVDNVTLPVQVTVYGITGEVYLSQTFDFFTFGINLLHYPTGTLLVRITCGDKYVIKQIIKL